MDAELRFAPTVHLFECLDDPVMACRIFLDPVVEGGEHRANEIGFLKPVIDLFGVSAKEEFLHFFIHAGGAGLLKEGGVATDGVVVGLMNLEVEGTGKSSCANHAHGIFGKTSIGVADDADEALFEIF